MSERRTPQVRTERPPGASGLVGALLYAGFWLALLIPRIRLWRRRSSWGRIRWAGLAWAACLMGAGVLASRPWVFGIGTGLLVLAAWLGPLLEPHGIQERAARLGADYVLNGGTLSGTPVTLFLTEQEILVTAREGEVVLKRIQLADLKEVRIAGERYRPRSTPPPKESARREPTVPAAASVELELVRDSGEPLRLIYRGAFAGHLAEVAAHTLLSVRSDPQALRIVSAAKRQKSVT